MKKAFLIVAMVCMIALTVVVGTLVVHVDRMVKHSDALVVEANKRLVYTSQNVNAILLHVDLVTGRLERASRAQEQVSAKTLSILDHADQVLTQVNKSTSDISVHTVQALDSIPPALEEVTNTTHEVNKLVADPSIKQSLTNVELATAQTAESMKNVAATTDDVKQIADHYKKEITKPVSFFKRLGGYVLTGLKAVMIFK